MPPKAGRSCFTAADTAGSRSDSQLSVDRAIALAARCLLAGVLVVAAVAKLRARAETSAEFSALLGVRAGPVLAVIVPVVEILLAIALVAWWSAIPGLVTAFVLLAFT